MCNLYLPNVPFLSQNLLLRIGCQNLTTYLGCICAGQVNTSLQAKCTSEWIARITHRRDSFPDCTWVEYVATQCWPTSARWNWTLWWPCLVSKSYPVILPCSTIAGANRSSSFFWPAACCNTHDDSPSRKQTLFVGSQRPSFE